MSKAPKQLSNCQKRNERSVVLIVYKLISAVNVSYRRSTSIRYQKGVVLNYETKSKRNKRNETRRNEILRNATKYTKMRNETQRNKIY